MHGKSNCKKHTLKYIARLLTAVLLLGVLSGCADATPTANSESATPRPTLNSTSYGDFTSGMTAFFDNYTIIKNEITNKLAASGVADDLNSDEKRAYYDNFMLLMTVTDIELSSLAEYDLLDTVADNSDRAEGNLIISGHYGYKIKRNSQIRFGCDSVSSESMYSVAGTLEENKNLLTMTIDERIQENVVCKTVIEIIISGDNLFLMRCAKSVVDGSGAAQTTKTACILLKGSNAELSYYEGSADINNYVAFDMLVDYNMNAMTFGVGTVLNFDVNV